jgi:hypothetical protein
MDEETQGMKVLEKYEIDPEKVVESPVTVVPREPQSSSSDAELADILK